MHNRLSQLYPEKGQTVKENEVAKKSIDKKKTSEISAELAGKSDILTGKVIIFCCYDLDEDTGKPKALEVWPVDAAELLAAGDAAQTMAGVPAAIEAREVAKARAEARAKAAEKEMTEKKAETLAEVRAAAKKIVDAEMKASKK